MRRGRREEVEEEEEQGEREERRRGGAVDIQVPQMLLQHGNFFHEHLFSEYNVNIIAGYYYGTEKLGKIYIVCGGGSGLIGRCTCRNTTDVYVF